MSSIQEEVSANTIANEIRMERAAFSGSFLLVEGATDARLFGRFVNKSECSTIACLGREKLFGAISILEEQEFSGALAVADRDFCDLIGYPPYKGIIIFTDENDVETQILSSPALKYVLDEFGSEAKINAVPGTSFDTIHLKVASWSSALGALRLASLTKGWCLKFSGMKYQFVSNSSPEICAKKTVAHVLARSSGPNLPSVGEAYAAIEDTLKDHSHWVLSHGHDCVAVLGKALNRTLGNTNKFNSEDGREDLEKILRISYSQNLFSQARVFSQIRMWEKATGYTVLS